MFTPALEKTFEDIFGGQADNQERLDKHQAKKGNHLLKYEYNGETGFACAKTERLCRQRALIKCNGDDYQELSMETLEGWIER